MIRVKICGLTSEPDARAAADAGADAVGFVFAPSPRRIEPERAAIVGRALPPFLSRVGVFVDEPLEAVASIARTARLHVIQLHGGEERDFVRAVRERTGLPVIKAVAVRDEASVVALDEMEADGLLLDAYDPALAGGTGVTFDWRLARLAMERLRAGGKGTPVILAGGLNPDNVQDAVQFVKPYGVDVSSGVELSPGKKCPDKIARFVRKARA